MEPHDEHAIRRARDDDAELAARLLLAMMEENAPLSRDALAPSAERSAALAQLVRDYLASDRHLVLLADAAPGGALGLAMARVDRLPPVYVDVPLLHVAAVWVRRDARRRGLGRRLVEETFAWGRARGCAEVRLNVLADNPARALYDAMGFAETQIQMRRSLR